MIILHGSGGMQGNATWLRALARGLAERGYVAFVPAYMEKSGLQSSSLLKSYLHFRAWLDAVHDCVTAVAADPRVDSSRIGVVGLSLGSFLGLSEAAGDSRVRCVVEYFGGLPPAYEKSAVQMPPVLILHGEKDQVVSVAEARKLDGLLTRLKRTHDIHIYPDQGHGFVGVSADDARRRALRFLDRYLGH